MFDFDLFRSAAEVYEGVNDTVLAQDAAEIVTAETIMESPVIQGYLDGSLTGDTAAKELLATAIIIANNMGYISLPEKYANPQSIGAIADAALETLKIAYDLATGKMSADEVIDYCVKKAAAKAKTAVDYLIDNGIAAEVITDVLIVFFPQVAPLKRYIKKCAQFVATKSKPLIHKGIDKTAEVAKSTAKKGLAKLKESVPKLVAKLSSLPIIR